MKTYQVVVKTDNEDQTISKIKSLLPEGFIITGTYYPPVKGEIGTYTAEGETCELALKYAIREVSKRLGSQMVITPKETFEARLDSVTIFAFDEVEAKEKISNGRIKEIKLVKDGKKGFLGIGKKPNEYQVNVFQLAKAVVSFKWKEEASIYIEPISTSGVFYFFDSKPMRSFGVEETFDRIYFEAQKCDPDWVFDSNHNNFICGQIDKNPKFQHNVELIGYERLNPLQKLKRFLEEGQYLNLENSDINKVIKKLYCFDPDPVYVIGFGGSVGLYQVKELHNVIIKSRLGEYLGYATSNSLSDCAFHLHLLKDDNHQQLIEDSKKFAANLKKYAITQSAKDNGKYKKPDFYFPSVVREMKKKFAENGFKLKDKNN
jgi:hypothetical protein